MRENLTCFSNFCLCVGMQFIFLKNITYTQLQFLKITSLVKNEVVFFGGRRRNCLERQRSISKCIFNNYKSLFHEALTCVCQSCQQTTGASLLVPVKKAKTNLSRIPKSTIMFFLNMKEKFEYFRCFRMILSSLHFVFYP
jgi:hypothetical protein